MATFEATRGQLTQEHFEILEIDLPVITGTCTVGASDGFGTPLTCDQAWSSEYKTYKFTNTNAPLLSEPIIYRVISRINENPTEVKPGNGLGARGTLKITFNDFKADPNEGATGVTAAVKAQGTFFGKLAARQIMENKTVRLKLYRVETDGTIDLTNGAETHYYIVESLQYNDNGTWTLDCKDIMSLANLDEKTWPPTSGGYLRLDVDDTVTSIPVDSVTDYSATFAVRIGDEFMKILSVSNNLTATAALNVDTRGSAIVAPVSTVQLTRTRVDSHSAGDEVFICDLSDNETIDSLLTRILVASDFDVALIPAAAWASEVAEWHATDKINTLHSESDDVSKVLHRILSGFLMDLWFDQVDNLAKLSAISVWKTSAATLTEGKEIEAYTLKTQAVEDLRASRALVIYDKTYLADDDSVTSYKKASQFSDNQIISEALYKEHKDKVFESSHLIDEDAADLLTQRWVSRFKYTPFNYKWTTQERSLTFKAGDVVDINSISLQSSSGLPDGNIRAQVTKITPKYTDDGRMYDCIAMGYAAAFNNNSEIVLDSPLNEVDLYILAGAPSAAVTLTFVLSTTYSQGETAIFAGNFAAGSKIILILANGFDAQANGGVGGKGQSTFNEPDIANWQSGVITAGGVGGIVYDANGVDTDIYFSGATPSAAFPTADGYIRAPGGGGGGSVSPSVGTDDSTGYGGNGGGGGAGIAGGLGGDGGVVVGIGPYNEVDGAAGTGGDILGAGGVGGTGVAVDGGAGGAWGAAGSAASAGEAGGLAGSGVIDGGATVTFFGSSGTRYINGNGDH
jgi:hypothetical protein